MGSIRTGMSVPDVTRRQGWDRDPRRTTVGRPDPRRAGRDALRLTPAKAAERPVTDPAVVGVPEPRRAIL